ncbi:hypothetical protein OG203_26935 [Nocardia sp. NBC_01499]|uniref:hypothetical protein n=1 Tax=Nocardia sp. NBC_01499 TaxID=2903597 RepID=UPI00386892A3
MSDKIKRTIRAGIPIPPVEILHIREDAKSYVEAVISLYRSIAFDEEDQEEKAKLEAERDRQSDILREMPFMHIDEARRIVADYPELIRRLREKDRWGARE